ncbi:hypothetical protein HY492_02840 [Candidatus Woesearchaeota archaeon]|nr:hypothetical protein [Candidatus Woesearchaeota archaeon]
MEGRGAEEMTEFTPVDPAVAERELRYQLHGGVSRKDVTVKVACKVLQAVYFNELKTVALPQDVMQYQFGVPMPEIQQRVHRAELEVAGHPVLRKIQFNGKCRIEAGDTIDAYVVCGDERTFYATPPKTRRAYEKREMRRIEVADRIEKIHGETVCATYHAEQP